MIRENIFSVQNKGRTVYVEVDPSRDDLAHLGMVWASTRTLWPTSAFGQIEQAGYIFRNRLIPLPATKAADKIFATLEARAMRRSQLAYDVAKTAQPAVVAKSYPPTYAGMIEQAHDEGTAESYRYTATVIRRSRNLTRQGRANALRDLRDATHRSGLET